MKNAKKELIKYIIENIVIFSIIYLVYLMNIRICIVYNLFRIPCPGCGLSRAVVELLKGNLVESLNYNVLLIPLICLYIIYSFFYIKALFDNINYLNKILRKYRIIIIITAVIIMVIVELINLKNPKLY